MNKNKIKWCLYILNYRKKSNMYVNEKIEIYINVYKELFM